MGIRTLALAAAAASAACSNGGKAAPQTAPLPEMSSAVSCGGGHPMDAPFSITEGTNPAIDGWQVGVSDIWKRPVAIDRDVTTEQLTASVARYESTTRHEIASIIVHAGVIIDVGERNYCVTSITASLGATRGKITLRRWE